MTRTSGNDLKRTARFRFVVRCCVLLLSGILVLPIWHWPTASMIWPSFSSFIMVGSVAVTRVLSLSVVVGWPILLITMLRHRWFCHWACPVGLMTEAAGRLPNPCRMRSHYVPRIGRLLLMATIGGCLFGFPAFLWLDPLALFHGAFSVTHSGPAAIAGRISAGILVGLLVCSWLIPGFWCTRTCPLGATQDFLIVPFRWLCRRRAGQSRVAAERMPLSRRRLLGLSVNAAGIAVGALLAVRAKRSIAAQELRLRPPGALESPTFAATCIRCGNCVRSCPSHIIQPDINTASLPMLLAPSVSFDDDYCREGCHRCNQVCPSGAIRRLTKKEKQKWVIGQIQFEAELCLLYDNGECDRCKTVCPYDAVSIVWNDDAYLALPRVDASRCPGCGACQVICPGTNHWEQENADHPVATRKAIRVELPQDLFR